MYTFVIAAGGGMGMEREIYGKLLEWKASPQRKPLILNGARQTGKTWILKEFGKNEYKHLAYISCDNNPDMQNVFTDFNPDRLIRVFSAITETAITKGDTLIVLDEIQEVPLGLTAPKYFCESAPDYHIAVAGSLLGLNSHKGSGFPVGKVDELNLYPLSFREFLMALGKNALLDFIVTHRWEEYSVLKDSFRDLLTQYYYTGGMPEVVDLYARTKDILEVRKIQNRILHDYRRDFSKHVPAGLLPKVNLVWDSIPSQLAKENKKFVYGMIKKGSRAKDFEDAIQWLIDAGLVYKVNRTKKIQKPLKFYEDFSAFKLFLSDLGLLGAMSDVPAKDILLGSRALVEYKGAFTEQYVNQQIVACGIKPYYYTNENSTLEIDFVVQTEDVHPVEVKAKENLKSKSLQSVRRENEEMTAWRFSMSDYRDQGWLVNVPLYLVQEWLLCTEKDSPGDGSPS